MIRCPYCLINILMIGVFDITSHSSGFCPDCKREFYRVGGSTYKMESVRIDHETKTVSIDSEDEE